MKSKYNLEKMRKQYTTNIHILHLLNDQFFVAESFLKESRPIAFKNNIS